MLNMTLFGRVLQITQCDSRQCTKPTLSPRTGIPILGQGNLPRDQLLNTKPKPRGSRVPESTRSSQADGAERGRRRRRASVAASPARRHTGGPRRWERTRPSPRERGEGGGGKLGKGREPDRGLPASACPAAQPRAGLVLQPAVAAANLYSCRDF